MEAAGWTMHARQASEAQHLFHAMKTISTHIYSFNELSEQAQAKALDSLRANVGTDYLGEEMLSSLKAVCEACNLRLVDWRFGIYCQNWKVKLDSYNPAVLLSGPRALAWFLRVLINHGYARSKHFKDMQFPGVCGFTGVCYDDNVVETVWKELLDGETVARAFDQVAKTFCDLWESEDDYAHSDECILDYLDKDEEQFTESGELA